MTQYAVRLQEICHQYIPTVSRIVIQKNKNGAVYTLHFVWYDKRQKRNRAHQVSLDNTMLLEMNDEQGIARNLLAYLYDIPLLSNHIPNTKLHGEDTPERFVYKPRRRIRVIRSKGEPN